MPPKRQLLPESQSESQRSSRRRLEEGSNQPTTSTGGHTKALWSRVSTVLRGLEKSSSVLAPLKSGIATLADCVTEIPEADKRRQEFCDIAESLVSLSETLTEHIQTSSSTFMSSCVMNVVNVIQQDINDIKNRQRGNTLSRIGTATQEEDDLIKYYRRVESHFRQLQINATLSTWSILNEQLANSRLDRLHPVSAATYNSAQSSQIRRRTCSPNTRAGVLDDLTRWATWIDSPKLYWMNGMAGTGKTTISCSLSNTLRRLCLLGASFFCSRTLPDCRDVSRIVPTIAYQLARFSLPFQSALCQVIGKDQDVANYVIPDQFETLILKPLLEVKDAIPANVVVVIDALDECSASIGTSAILDLLFRYAAKLPVKFFVTSRPEPSISDRMLAQDNRSRSMFVLHDIEALIVQADIETYLSSELACMSPPPSATQIQQLACKAGSLFIYAATALRYILPENSAVDSHDRLNIMLGMTSTPHSRRHNEIDALYCAILTDVVYNPRMDPEEIGRIRQVLHTIICVMEPITTLTLAILLRMDEHKVELALKPLRSVIQISASHGVLTTLHASFPNYMLDRERSKTLFCDREKHCGPLAQRCLELMSSNLRFNICELESSFDLDEDVPDLPSRMDIAIPPHLLYACRYWMRHLVDSGGEHNSVNISLLLTDFLAVKLLFWMEVLNLRKSIHLCYDMLSEACYWLQEHDTPNYLLQICVDARSFSKMFSSNPVSSSTPHLYVSGLPLCQKDSAMWRWYGSRAKGLANINGSAVNRRAYVPLENWEAYLPTNPVAYSPNGAWAVSGSCDCTIRIWDVQTGSMVAGALEGHTDWVTSVAFSPDGTRVVSGSDDETIRVWDTQSGNMVAGPFKGPACSITSVTFSPDGARVISGSDDGTIRIWDAQIGSMVAGPLQGYIYKVTAVASSPDGTHVVSGSANGCIQIWDTQSGKLVVRSFGGHTSSVWSVAFSPDGARVLSKSDCDTIRTWDAQSGNMVAEVSDDEQGSAWSVAFSPDGTRVASGHSDCTIRIWDAQSGSMVAGPFEGHTDSVLSVTFSPDGTRVASGSCDSTAWIWDAQSAMMVAGPLEGHTDSVWSVAFSPDGARIVSGSGDRAIRIWDAQTGSMVADPFEGHTDSVWSVAFSPDGALVVSGSDDCTIRIWDAQSGSMVAEAFKGHRSPVYSVAFSPDSTRVFSCYQGGTIRIWDVRSGSMVLGPSEGNTSRSGWGELSSNGTRVVSISDDDKNTIQIWDTQSGNTVAGPFEGHIDDVLSVALSPDGARVVSSSENCSIRIWDTLIGSSNLITSTSHWSLDESGWIMNPNSQRLLWIPKVLRGGLKRAQNTLVIHPDGQTELCFDHALIGMQWRECFS